MSTIHQTVCAFLPFQLEDSFGSYHSIWSSRERWSWLSPTFLVLIFKFIMLGVWIMPACKIFMKSWSNILQPCRIFLSVGEVAYVLLMWPRVGSWWELLPWSCALLLCKRVPLMLQPMGLVWNKHWALWRLIRRWLFLWWDLWSLKRGWWHLS